MKSTMLTLNDIKTGQTVVIKNIMDVGIATQAMRMGIAIGESVTCIARVPAGPTVIQKGGMELAIGEGLCCQIEVAFE